MVQKLKCVVVVALVFASMQSARASLVAEWMMDEGSGDTITDTVLGVTGTISGAAWVNDAQQGWVLSFDGSGVVDVDTTTTNNFATVLDEMTVAFWQYGADDMYMTRSCVLDARAGTSQQAMVYMSHASGSVQWYCPTSPTLDYMSHVVDEELVEGAWSHWAFTKNATTGKMAIYRDGVEIAAVTDKTAQIDGVGITILTIGQKYNYTFGHKGLLSGLQFYDSELSQSEIMSLVPEPATIAFLGLGALAIRRRRRF